MWWVSLALAFPRPDPAADPDPEAARLGEVLETFDSGGFTYARLRTTAGPEEWIAGPLTPLDVGQTVATTEGALMADFHSRTLDRTFDRIWFVVGLRVMGVEDAAAAPAGPLPVVAGARAVAAVYADGEALAGQRVTVAGRVARASGPVLGRWWLHVQDGSGDAGLGTHDLTVTTAAPVAVGAAIRAEGTVRTDVDLGSGYRFAVLLEDAAVTEVTP